MSPYSWLKGMSLSQETSTGRIQSPLVFPFVVYTLVSFATLLLEVPLIRLFETAICNRHYLLRGNAIIAFVNDDVDESACKIPAVQDLLANVVGWKISFDAIPGIPNPLCLSPRNLFDVIRTRHSQAKLPNRTLDCNLIWIGCHRLRSTICRVTITWGKLSNAIMDCHYLYVSRWNWLHRSARQKLKPP